MPGTLSQSKDVSGSRCDGERDAADLWADRCGQAGLLRPVFLTLAGHLAMLVTHLFTSIVAGGMLDIIREAT